MEIFGKLNISSLTDLLPDDVIRHLDTLARVKSEEQIKNTYADKNKNQTGMKKNQSNQMQNFQKSGNAQRPEPKTIRE